MGNKKTLFSFAILAFIIGFVFSGLNNAKNNQEKILVEALEREVIETCLDKNESKSSFIECDNSITYISNFLQENDYKETDEYRRHLREKVAKNNFLKNIKKETK